jgi:hypothetical protein
MFLPGEPFKFDGLLKSKEVQYPLKVPSFVTIQENERLAHK